MIKKPVFSIIEISESGQQLSPGLELFFSGSIKFCPENMAALNIKKWKYKQ